MSTPVGFISSSGHLTLNPIHQSWGGETRKKSFGLDYLASPAINKDKGYQLGLDPPDSPSRVSSRARLSFSHTLVLLFFFYSPLSLHSLPPPSVIHHSSLVSQAVRKAHASKTPASFFFLLSCARSIISLHPVRA